ncbi:MAG: hypothetical protein IJG86_02240, partial [Clostridia bacterium]|nr:hypothetical protein [Clostridia bacterium]
MNGSRVRALAARPLNLRRLPSRLLNCSRWKAENHAKLEIIQFSVIICVCEQVVFEKKSRQITRFQFWRDYFRV